MDSLSLHLSTIVFVLGATFIAGVLGGIAGGGGLITLPMILAAGLPPQTALGTNKMLAAMTTLSSTLVYAHKGYVQLKRWRLLMLITVVMTIVGVAAVQYISTLLLSKLLPLVIIFAALYSFFVSSQRDSTVSVSASLPIERQHTLSSLFVSGALGFYSSVVGSGLGLFWTSCLQFFYDIEIVKAAAIARAMCFVSNITALFCFMMVGRVNFVLGVVMGCVMSLGGYVGAKSAIQFGGRYVRTVLLLASIITSLYLLFHK